jgi:protein-disulfide isomerase
VTLVEFTDFHCPFCGRAVATLKDVMREYDGKIRWVFRDFPIASLHPRAAKAAEAARCAGEQGKFWEYHDLLFGSQSPATIEDFKRSAEQLKLDPKRFGQCLECGKHQAAVEADVQEGARLGVTGTRPSTGAYWWRPAAGELSQDHRGRTARKVEIIGARLYPST